MSVPKVAGLRKINYHVRHEQQNNYVLPSPKIGGWDAYDWLKFACVAELSRKESEKQSKIFFNHFQQRLHSTHGCFSW